MTAHFGRLLFEFFQKRQANRSRRNGSERGALLQYLLILKRLLPPTEVDPQLFHSATYFSGNFDEALQCASRPDRVEVSRDVHSRISDVIGELEFLHAGHSFIRSEEHTSELQSLA